MSKTTIRILVAALTLLVLAALITGGIRRHRERLQEAAFQQAVQAAEALYAAGSYTEARDAFLALSLTDRAKDCDTQLQKRALAEAEALLQNGQYRKAREAFLALGDFENAAERLPACDYAEAQALMADGRFADAFPILEALGDYPGAEELNEKAHGALYDKAREAAYACRVEEAAALFDQLGDYRDAALIRRRCQERMEHLLSDDREPVRYSEYAGSDIGTGTLYWHRVGQVFVPRDAGPETRCMIFFPGGYDESLPNAYMGEMIYAQDPPNAIMLFCHTNGFYTMADKVEDCYQVLEQAGIENNVFLHDLVLCGASNGAYPACRAAAWLYENHALPANHVVSFDAGNHWAMLDSFLTPAECDITAEAGTRFLLLEGAGIGMNVRAIELLVAHGNDVTIAKCARDGHEQIPLDGVRLGIVDWTLGKGERPDSDNYSYYPLDPSSTYPAGT